MKVAILFSGRLNIDDEIFNNFKNVFLNEVDCDVFVSHSKGYSSEYIDKFVEMYKPVKIIESDEAYPVKIYTERNFRKNRFTIIPNALRMYLNRKYVYNLFTEYINETNTKYDMIIYSRLDLFFNCTFKYIDIYNVINTHTNIILVPEGFDYEGGLNDQFAIMKPNEASIYSGVYDNIYRMVFEEDIELHPETLLKVHLKKYNITVGRFNCDYYIKRELK